ncbi:hypothetical protein GPLA_2946 [Paraglaciecola polaris LMG 21857]|uniref:Uncharacterized protein n=1 Tax=Paraglaciecola polaris LMG 21857 TaxID=1129793 RepID=K6YMD5_9ALTE|nr:hypothetical protein GPLA_2946 [Paraglaciecola polaris LMG 21857]
MTTTGAKLKPTNYVIKNITLAIKIKVKLRLTVHKCANAP